MTTETQLDTVWRLINGVVEDKRAAIRAVDDRGRLVLHKSERDWLDAMISGLQIAQRLIERVQLESA